MCCTRYSSCIVTMDIEKVFDSLDHGFLLSVLRKFDFSENGIYCTKTLLNDQQSCVVNETFTTPYIKLQKVPS